MNLLLDTNVLIPLEPASGGLQLGTPLAAELAMLANRGGHSLYLHPAVRVDIERDRNPSRRGELLALAQKYPRLPNPPDVPAGLSCIVGEAAPGTNDFVDDLLLSAVYVDAVDILVTEDRRQAIFDYDRENRFLSIYVTLFDKVKILLNLFREFGFTDLLHKSSLGELVIAKPLLFDEDICATMEPLQFNIRYGPYEIGRRGACVMVLI